MFWLRKKKRPEQLQVPKITFVREQDGDAERNLKQKIVPLLEARDYVHSAYLVRATYDNTHELNVALCIRMEQGDDSGLRKAVGDVFATMFNRQEHLDIAFIRNEQEDELKQVCRAFYEKKYQHGIDRANS